MGNMIRNNRGWMRLIEVVFASALVFAYLMYLQNLYITEEARSPESDTVVLKMQAQDILQTLNHKDSDHNNVVEFRQYVIQNSAVNAQSEIDALMPQNIGYTLHRMNESLTWECFVGCSSQIPSEREVVSAEHIISDLDRTGSLLAVKLMVWYVQ
jgi:hypothetical protein